MTIIMNKKIIGILGGTGFIGTHLTNRLSDEGYRLKILTRHRERNRHLLVLPTVQLVEADAHDSEQLKTHFSGCDALINLVGILNEKEHDGSGFQHVHVELAKKVLQVCKDCGITRLLHMSALNADASNGTSHYLRTKGEAEDYVLTSANEQVNVTCFRPSVIFGPNDNFLTRLNKLLTITPLVLPIACPNTRFSPVYVGDVTAAFANALQNKGTYGKSYDLCGPHDYTFKELAKYVGHISGHRRWIMGLPDPLSKLQAMTMEYFPGKPFSRDNYDTLSQDSLCKYVERCPTSLESIVPVYLGNRNLQDQYQEFRASRWEA